MPASISSLSLLDSHQISTILRLRQIGQAIAKNTERISTLKRINSAADDPAGLITASRLQSQLDTLEVTSRGISRADSLVATAADASSQIVDQLIEARSLTLAAAGGSLSSSEIAANQAQVDQILRSVDRLAGTEFGGRRLLDGSSGFGATGVDSTKIASVEVLDKQTADNVSVSINVTTQATQAQNSYTGGTLGAGATLQIAGPEGTTAISLDSGATTTDIAEAFNSVTALTGITATRIDASRVDFKTADYGSEADLEISTTEGSFNLTTSGTVSGTDAVATINGQTVTGDGSTFTVTTDQATIRIAVNPTVSGVVSPFSVTGEGMIVTLGEDPSSAARFGLPTLSTGTLNSTAGALRSIASGGVNSLTSGNAANAARILGQALDRALRAESTLGSFQKYTLGSAGAVIDSTREHVADALNSVAGADVALETSLLTTNRLLQAATLGSLQIFNQQQQSVFNLLSDVAKGF